MDQNLRKRLEDGLDDLAPKLAEQILAKELTPIASEAELFGEAEAVKMPPEKQRRWKRAYQMAAGLAAMFALFFGFCEVKAYNQIEGQIIVDVNPSVALSVNRLGRVRRVEALNEDGAAVVDGLDKKKGDVGTVLESVFTSLETQDYLQSEQAGVLVSYCYEQESAAVEKKIQSSIVSLSGSRQNCTIFSQTFEHADAEEEKAKEAGVSVGKYYFVNRILEDPSVSAEVSYDKTMEEIVQLMDGEAVQVAGVEVYAGGEGASIAESGTEEVPETENSVVTVQATEIADTNAPSETTEAADTQIPAETEDTQQSANTQSPPDSQSAGTTASGSAVADSPEPGTQSTEQPGTEQPVDVSDLKLVWVTADFEEDQKVYIEWGSLAGASGYDVYYRSAAGSSFEQLAEGVTGTTCVVSGLAAGRSYIFRVVPYRTVDGENYYGKAQVSSEVEIPFAEPEPETETETETGDAQEEQTGRTEETDEEPSPEE